jgi:electron transfer flavoprotein alpha subunit
MGEIFVLVEHRQGKIRDVTFEMLTKGNELARKTNANLTAVLLGHSNIKDFFKTLSEYAKKVLVVDDAKLENFNSDAYQKVLESLIGKYKPLLTLIGHTSWGVDLAPTLSVSLKMPLATDCIDLEFENDVLSVTRQMYGGKVNARAILGKSESYIVTIRPGSLKAIKPQSPMNGDVIEIRSPLTEEITYKRVIKYVQPQPSGVDIASAEVLIGIGRGIGGAQNIPIFEELAKTLNGLLACSRPIVDKGWLPSDRQVGMSGKTVKPKLYIAFGISGAFQHVLGMKNSELIIAINKDPEAPIFKFADYRVVEDLFKIAPLLKSKIYEQKTQKT